MTVSARGAVRITGKLGDGTPMLATGQLDLGGTTCTLFVPLYGSKNPGTIAGNITFENFADSDWDGVLDWIKPAQPSATYYPGGFAITVDLLAAKYVPAPLRSGAFTLAGGDLPAAGISDSLTISSKNKTTVSGTNGVSLALTPGTGAFSGQFLFPGTNKKTPYSGVMYQKPAPPTGYGLFLGTVQSGEVDISQ